MKFTAQRLFEIAIEEYGKAGLLTGTEGEISKEHIGCWAVYSERQDYENEDAVRAELADYIKTEIEYRNDTATTNL